MDHKTIAVPPSVTAWWQDRAVREALVAFATGFALALFCILAVTGVI